MRKLSQVIDIYGNALEEYNDIGHQIVQKILDNWQEACIKNPVLYNNFCSGLVAIEMIQENKSLSYEEKRAAWENLVFSKDPDRVFPKKPGRKPVLTKSIKTVEDAFGIIGETFINDLSNCHSDLKGKIIPTTLYGSDNKPISMTSKERDRNGILGDFEYLDRETNIRIFLEVKFASKEILNGDYRGGSCPKTTIDKFFRSYYLEYDDGIPTFGYILFFSRNAKLMLAVPALLQNYLLYEAFPKNFKAPTGELTFDKVLYNCHSIPASKYYEITENPNSIYKDFVKYFIFSK